MNIFVTGATGYIGGTVSSRLLDAGHKIHGLARNQERAERLEERGIIPVLGSLEDFDVLHDAAQAADAVINAANADNPFAARVLVDALRGSGKTLLHTSGTSTVADNANGAYSDAIYHEDSILDPLPEKTGRIAIDRMVCGAAHDGVRAVVLSPCLIYGKGLGVRPDSIQVPMFIEIAKTSGVPRHLGAGENLWSHVHIEDCADAYMAAFEHATAGSYFYIEAGEASMGDLSLAVGRLLGMEPRTESLTLSDAVRAWGPPMAHGMGSNVRVRADKARAILGWESKGPGLLDDIAQGSYRDAV
ncbi:MAG: NAD-dependent epimerase/dehydratase family protein [Alphaproteobacteria bacterium]|jgi:nucleoside-diphosphate-sugar epimerase|nr:NAD-dependent epimerase/dehydratase family protein [Alphaproteobacteria bacterium]